MDHIDILVHSSECTNEYLVFALGKETEDKEVARPLVWAFRTLKCQRSQAVAQAVVGSSV